MTIGLGIAIVTYNRCKLLTQVIERLQKHTKTKFDLVVVDDESSDDTVATVRAMGVTTITGKNMGVCWNKNRGLYYLSQNKKNDVILLLEDDTYPIRDGWEDIWVKAALKYGNIGLAGDWFNSEFISGAGTLEAPIVSKAKSGQCEGFSREALGYVGYLDTRFKGYGVGHAEHSMRFVRAGYGGIFLGNETSKCSPAAYNFFLILSALQVTDPGGNRSEDQVRKNFNVLKSLENEQLHREAWRSDEEMTQFRGELSLGNELFSPASAIGQEFDEEYYLNQWPDVAQAVKNGRYLSGFHHYLRVGHLEKRAFSLRKK